MVERLKRVSLREVWKHEALDFTRWLEENVDILNEILGITLTSAEREHAAGAFSVDVLAEDEAGSAVVIENQLEASDHNHLGKLITYLTTIEASAAIWIVAEPRAEHVRAIAWLNESSTADFYLVKVEAISIADSPPAPLLTLIVGPADIGGGTTKREFAERYKIRRQFWTQLLETARQRTTLHSAISAGHHGWIGTGAGKYGLSYNYVVRQHDAHVELYIDRGKDKAEENASIFNLLYSNKMQIEAAFGEVLEWQRLEKKRACRIRKVIGIAGYRDEDEKWPQVQGEMIDAMMRLEAAMRPHIEQIDT